MSSRVLWQLGGAVGFVVILLLGWFLLVSPRYDTVATNDRLRADVERQNTALESAIAKISSVDVGALEDQVAVLQQLVPEGAQEPEMIRQLDAAATAAGVIFTQSTFDAPTVFVPTADGAGSVPLPIDPADLDAVTEAGLIVIPFSATAVGADLPLLTWVDKVQESGRLFLVQNVEFGAPGDLGLLGLTIRGYAFVLLAEDAT